VDGRADARAGRAREPGDEHQETLAGGGEAAAAGGVTTMVALPNTDPAIDEPALVEAMKSGQIGGAALDVICEVEQHLGENRVRAVAMKPTDGLQRGMMAQDLGEAITVPVGDENSPSPQQEGANGLLEE